MNAPGRQIFRASVVVIFAHVLFKLTGPIQARVILQYCGDDRVLSDLFFFGFEIMLMTFYLVGEEGLGPAFLPVFMEEKEKRGPDAAWRFAGTLLAVQVCLLAATVALIMAGPAGVVRFMTDWDAPGSAPAYMERAPYVVRWMIPALFGMSVGSTTYLMLNGYKRFFLAAFGDTAMKLLIIGTVLLGILSGGESAFWLCLGVSLGSLAKVGTHLLGLRGEARRLRWNFDLRSPAFRRFLLLVAPLLLGILFAKVRDIYNEGWILSHVPEEGLVTINKLGRKLFQAVGWLLPYSVSIAMYPFFCELVDRKDLAGLSDILAKSCRIILVLIVPVAALGVVLAFPLTRLFFQLKGFGLDECAMAARSTICYTLVLPFFALEYVFMQSFFSNRRMVAPVVVGLLFSGLSMVLSYLGVVIFLPNLAEWFARAGLIAEILPTATTAVMIVALAYTVSRTLKVATLAILLRRFLPGLGTGRALAFLSRVLLAGVICGVSGWAGRLLAGGTVRAGEDGFVQVAVAVLPVLAVSGAVGSAGYLLALRVLCPAEWRETLAWTRARFSRGRERDRAADSDPEE